MQILWDSDPILTHAINNLYRPLWLAIKRHENNFSEINIFCLKAITSANISPVKYNKNTFCLGKSLDNCWLPRWTSQVATTSSGNRLSYCLRRKQPLNSTWHPLFHYLLLYSLIYQFDSKFQHSLQLLLFHL